LISRAALISVMLMADVLLEKIVSGEAKRSSSA